MVEVAAQLVLLQVSKTIMSTDQIISELSKVFTGLINMDSGNGIDFVSEINSTLSIKEAS